jgi:hypothetical protein
MHWQWHDIEGKTVHTRKKLDRFCYLVQAAWHLFCRKTQNVRYIEVQKQQGGRIIAIFVSLEIHPLAYVRNPPVATADEDTQLALDTFQTCAIAARTTAELMKTVFNGT